MSRYSLHEVHDARTRREFLAVVQRIYAQDPVWVAVLEDEIEAVFDPKRNITFAEGQCIRWVLRDGEGQVCGRIAAFVHGGKAHLYEQPTGGAGFFECIDDQAAANTLFDAAKNWLAQQGMQAFDAPINFGENDRFSGLLVQGFTHPSYGMPYNPPYYQRLFEHYGFALYYEQQTRHLSIAKPLPERFEKVCQRILSRPYVRVEYIQRKNLYKYARDFRLIYNEAWQHHEHYSPMSEQQVYELADELRSVLIEEMMPFAYVNGEPAAFLLCLPDLNQIFKPFKGKFTWWQKLLFVWRSRDNFAWYRRRGILTRGRVTIMGVKPKYRRLGLEAALTTYPFKDNVRMGFTEIELSWVGEFNPLMLSLHDATGAVLAKVHHTYRYLFDRSLPPQRAKTIGVPHHIE